MDFSLQEKEERNILEIDLMNKIVEIHNVAEEIIGQMGVSGDKGKVLEEVRMKIKEIL